MAGHIRLWGLTGDESLSASTVGTRASAVSWCDRGPRQGPASQPAAVSAAGLARGVRSAAAASSVAMTAAVQPSFDRPLNGQRSSPMNPGSLGGVGSRDAAGLQQLRRARQLDDPSTEPEAVGNRRVRVEQRAWRPGSGPYRGAYRSGRCRRAMTTRPRCGDPATAHLEPLARQRLGGGERLGASGDRGSRLGQVHRHRAGPRPGRGIDRLSPVGDPFGQRGRAAGHPAGP